MIKDPDTGKRVSRPNPPAEWQIVEVPDLASVSKELFDAARHRKAMNKGVPMIHQRSSKRLLSGPLRCAACGGGMSTKGADRRAAQSVPLPMQNSRMRSRTVRSAAMTPALGRLAIRRSVPRPCAAAAHEARQS
jgi:hypothetical protein